MKTVMTPFHIEGLLNLTPCLTLVLTPCVCDH